MRVGNKCWVGRFLPWGFLVALAATLVLSVPALAQDVPTEAPDPSQIAEVDADQDSLTRGEAAVLLAQALGVEEEVWQGLFSDVGSDNSHAGTIEGLALAGVVTSDTDGRFRPSEDISRGEFAVWIDRGYFSAGFTSKPVQFSDIPEGAPYEESAQKLYAAGITAGCSADPLAFCGQDNLTVSQLHAFLGRVADLPYLISDCQEPGAWLLLCEAYEFIDSSYVLDVTVEGMVAPIAETLEQIETEVGEEGARRSQFRCSIPDPRFEPACTWARLVPDYSLNQVAESVVREVVKGLDPNSAYHDPEQWRQIEESGRYVGIGVRVITVDQRWQPGCSPLSPQCRILVLTVFEGGPAEKGGMQRGDFIVAVDGESVDGLTLADAAGIIRGEIGTSVDITIVRQGAEIRLPLLRQEIVVPYTSTAFHPTQSIAYLELTSFTTHPGGAVEEFRDQLSQMADYELLVLDLRNNGGGSVRVLQGIVGALLGGIPVMTFTTVEETYDVHGIGTPLVGEDSPQIAVLVNGFSASASEALAGLLHETGRAVVIGETTYKKNTGQNLFDLFNDGVFRLTTLRWTTPGGIDIGESGAPLDFETGFPQTDEQGLMEWVKTLLDDPPE